MINGIQHVGIGVRDRERSFAFYKDALGFAVPISKHTGNCKGVIPIIEKDENRNVIIPLNPYGGALVEIFQYTSKNPTPIPAEVNFSYNGFLFYGLKVKNIEKSLDIIEKKGGQILSRTREFTPLKDRRWKTAVFRDPDGIYGILLEHPESTIGYGNGRPKIGGIEYVSIGVSNLAQSVEFYTKIIGYEEIIYTYEGTSPEWDVMIGRGKKTKRALLKKKKRAQGQFRHFLRGGMIELIEMEDNTGKHNFEGRKWGDIGIMELCFDVTDIYSTLESVTKKGAQIIVPPYNQDMGMDTYAIFAYIKDPDGSKLEFADISSLPVPYFVIRLLVNPFVVGIARKLKLL
jgi:catechol 2,3-dioxygenase-like lactoylglutathione lyase family enzyme